jgi:hypothetical protein
MVLGDTCPSWALHEIKGMKIKEKNEQILIFLRLLQPCKVIVSPRMSNSRTKIKRSG